MQDRSRLDATAIGRPRRVEARLRRAAAWTSAALVAIALCAAAPAGAACLTDAEVASLLADYVARKPAPNPDVTTVADGECTRARLLALLDKQHGSPIGYKAGLTNPAVQKRFNADAPVWGALYSPMLLKDGAIVDASFGARPLFEADLLVRVSDAAINKAITPDEVLRAIDQVIPFIELPDLMVEAPPKLNGAGITAINVGARYGVVGAPIASQATPEFSAALRDMQVVVKDDGGEIDKGKGSDVLAHPLNAVVWLVKDLARDGRTLKPGDLVSLGSFSKLWPPKAGTTVQVVYGGLPGNPTVKVSFK